MPWVNGKLIDIKESFVLYAEFVWLCLQPRFSSWGRMTWLFEFSFCCQFGHKLRSAAVLIPVLCSMWNLLLLTCTCFILYVWGKAEHKHYSDNCKLCQKFYIFFYYAMNMHLFMEMYTVSPQSFRRYTTITSWNINMYKKRQKITTLLGHTSTVTTLRES